MQNVPFPTMPAVPNVGFNPQASQMSFPQPGGQAPGQATADPMQMYALLQQLMQQQQQSPPRPQTTLLQPQTQPVRSLGEMMMQATPTMRMGG